MLSTLKLLFLATAVSSFQLPGRNYIYDGRAPFSLTADDLDTSTGPYLTAVQGQNESASHYTTLLGRTSRPTPLYNSVLLFPDDQEQVLAISIDNTSVFVPGGGAPQLGFRRTELIAQLNGSSAQADAVMEVGKTVFHFSIKADETRPLNYSHEYQVVFIEPSDGTHVFGVQLGSPFTNPTGKLPASNAHSFKILDHNLNVLFSTPFLPLLWHNFAITVDWVHTTLAVAYSIEGAPLRAVAPPSANLGVGVGVLGDFHFGVLKLPIVNPADSPADQGDVVHHGIQEGTREALLYSGVFVVKDA
ncbi:hypothetical protein C8F01DRAFT_1064849 [Mycena amicta]|nr:hypothetical protein C8F01DRAFT_1064849 [Mycena amicta]